MVMDSIERNSELLKKYCFVNQTNTWISTGVKMVNKLKIKQYIISRFILFRLFFVFFFAKRISLLFKFHFDGPIKCLSPPVFMSG